MSEPVRITDYIDRKNADITGKREALNASGGDGTSGGMEERVQKLEADIAELKKGVAVIQEGLKALATKGDFADVAGDLGTLNERSRHMLTASDLSAAKDAIGAAVRSQITIAGSVLAALMLAIRFIGGT